MSRVLIVDDEESICWAFREFLTDEGHVVDVASSAEEGLSRAEEARPDALVLDIRLPGLDGLSAMGRFRRPDRRGTDDRHHGLRQPGDRRPGDGGGGVRLPRQAVRPRSSGGGDRPGLGVAREEIGAGPPPVWSIARR